MRDISYIGDSRQAMSYASDLRAAFQAVMPPIKLNTCSYPLDLSRLPAMFERLPERQTVVMWRALGRSASALASSEMGRCVAPWMWPDCHSSSVRTSRVAWSG